MSLDLTPGEVKHPYITADQEIKGGSPVILGTHTKVMDIAIRYELAGMTPDQIIEQFPHLTLDAGDLGKSDEYHLERASELGAVILTHDVDFLKIAHQWNREGKEHKGISYAHPLDLSLGEYIRRVELVTQVLTEEEMKDHIEFP